MDIEKLNPDEWHAAGKLSRAFALTDDELALAIKTTECTLAYLEATKISEACCVCLRLELSTLYGFFEARRLSRNHGGSTDAVQI